jgi:hypothetical protein
MPLWQEAARGEGATTGFAGAVIGGVNAGCASHGIAVKVAPRKTPKKTRRNRVAEMVGMR